MSGRIDTIATMVTWLKSSRHLRRAADLIEAVGILLSTLLWALTRRPLDRSGTTGQVVLDASYTWDQLRERGLEYAVSARDCDGLFERVWSVNPLVGAGNGADIRSPLLDHQLEECHRFVEFSVSGGRPAVATTLKSFFKSQRALLHFLRGVASECGLGAVRVGDPLYLGAIGWWLARLVRCPLIVRVNANYDLLFKTDGQLGYPRLLRSRRVERLLSRLILSRADLVLVPSEDNRRYATNNGAVAERVKVSRYGSLIHPVHFGEPSERLGVREELGIGANPLMVSVTRLESVKRVEDLIYVLSVVKRELPDVVCVIAGDGAMRSTLHETAREVGVDGSLVLVGNRPQTWLASLLADADTVVFPLAGRALVEAALSGSPLVVYDLEWHHELVEDGVSGRLVTAGDTNAMGLAVIEAIRNPEEAAAMATCARQKAMEEYDRTRLIAEEREHVMRAINSQVGRKSAT